jgi:hypothetical protein
VLLRPSVIVVVVARVYSTAMLKKHFAIDIHFISQRRRWFLLCLNLPLPRPLSLHILQSQPPPLWIISAEPIVAIRHACLSLFSHGLTTRRWQTRDTPYTLMHLARLPFVQRTDGALCRCAHACCLLLHAPEGHSAGRASAGSSALRVVSAKRESKRVGFASDARRVGDEGFDVCLAHGAAAVSFEPLICAFLVIGVQTRQHAHLIAVFIVHEADGTGDQRTFSLLTSSSARLSGCMCVFLKAKDICALL